MFAGPYVASIMAGLVPGMIVGDILGAVPMSEPSAVPATSGAAAPKVTKDGQVVAGDMTARQIVFLSCAYVIGAMLFLIFGARALKDARVA